MAESKILKIGTIVSISTHFRNSICMARSKFKNPARPGFFCEGNWKQLGNNGKTSQLQWFWKGNFKRLAATSLTHWEHHQFLPLVVNLRVLMRRALEKRISPKPCPIACWHNLPPQIRIW
jgi:hypothetical protein